MTTHELKDNMVSDFVTPMTEVFRIYTNGTVEIPEGSTPQEVAYRYICEGGDIPEALTLLIKAGIKRREK